MVVNIILLVLYLILAIGYGWLAYLFYKRYKQYGNKISDFTCCILDIICTVLWLICTSLRVTIILA